MKQYITNGHTVILKLKTNKLGKKRNYSIS